MQRKDLQGKESPAGSGKYPEPKWLGMIQHDMMMFDHGMPKKDGSMSKEQRPEADVNIEYQITSKLGDAAMQLARKVQTANEKYATNYPANIGPHMTNTDSTPFMDITPSLSLREAERGSADREWMGSASSSADGCLYHVQRRRLPAGVECGSDHVGRDRGVDRGKVGGRGFDERAVIQEQEMFLKTWGVVCAVCLTSGGAGAGVRGR